MISVRMPRGRECDDLGRQAVAELEAVRHQELDRRSHRGETAHPDRAGGRAIGIVIGDDQQPFAALDRAGKPLARGVDAFQRLPRRQTGQVVVELRGRCDAARGEYARHDRARCRRRRASPRTSGTLRRVISIQRPAAVSCVDSVAGARRARQRAASEGRRGVNDNARPRPDIATRTSSAVRAARAALSGSAQSRPSAASADSRSFAPIACSHTSDGDLGSVRIHSTSDCGTAATSTPQARARSRGSAESEYSDSMGGAARLRARRRPTARRR